MSLAHKAKMIRRRRSQDVRTSLAVYGVSRPFVLDEKGRGLEEPGRRSAAKIVTRQAVFVYVSKYAPSAKTFLPKEKRREEAA